MQSELAPVVGADPDLAERAARLAKADLVTEMVGEFPELQGLMGRYYAALQGEHPSVAAAIEEHYKPLGPSDRVPTDQVSVAVALADKIDTLVGFWAIDEKPTGSKDPYALRRAALGVIRLVLENDMRINLRHFVVLGLARLGKVGDASQLAEAADSLLQFIAESLRVQLREQGARHDLLDAVFAKILARPGDQPDASCSPCRSARPFPRHRRRPKPARRLSPRRQHPAHRGEAERRVLRRSARPRPRSRAGPDRGKALAEALEPARRKRAPPSRARISRAPCERISRLRRPVDAFFDKVTVNAEDPNLRENRLKLLNGIREATGAVADFSRIEG